jgi:hypothetical protein
VASIERTAYPRFKRIIAAKKLREAFTPSADEVAWAREATRAPGHLLGLVVLLKCFQRLGYFPKLADVPAAVTENVRDCLELPGEVALDYDADRTLRHHKALVRDRLGVVHAPEQARKLAEEVIREAAQAKDNPADLINVALEELVRGRYELPGYTTLDALAARVRAEVNTALFATIGARLTPADRAGLERLLEVDPATHRSGYDRLKQPARAATLTKSSSTWPTWPGSMGGGEHARGGWCWWRVCCTRRRSVPATRSRPCSASAWPPSPRRPRSTSSGPASSTAPTPSGCWECSATCWARSAKG